MITETDLGFVDDIVKGVPYKTVQADIQKALSVGYDVNHDGYFLLVRLINEGAYREQRLQLMNDIVQLPSFQLKEKESPQAFILAFAMSSYWLDTELFNDSTCRKPVYCSDLSAVQKAHVQMLDIGSALIDKGFSFDWKMPVNANDGSHMSSYVNTFLKQCKERNIWLKQ